MQFFKRKPKTNKPETNEALVLDFGSSSLKVLQCRYFPDHVEIIGGKKVRYADNSKILDDDLDPQALAQAASQALVQAGITLYPKMPAVVGIGALGVEGYTSQINYRRASSEKIISESEFNSILQKVENRAGRIMTGMIAWETAAGGESALINSEVLDLSLDGYGIASPVGLKGERLSFIVYNAYTRDKMLRSVLQTVRLMDLHLMSVTASHYATLRMMLERQKPALSAVVLDIGAASTDVGVIKSGRIIGHQSFDVAGDSFTASISDELGGSLAEAEALKLGFAAAKLSSLQMKDVREIIAADCKVFLSGVELVMKEFPGISITPQHLMLVGGGSLLPGVLSSIQAGPWDGEGEPLTVSAEMVTPRELTGFRDLTGVLNSSADVAPLSVAIDAVDILAESGKPSGFWQRFKR